MAIPKIKNSTKKTNFNKDNALATLKNLNDTIDETNSEIEQIIASIPPVVVPTCKVYKALFKQTGNYTTPPISSGTLIIGHRYVVTGYIEGDDFSNMDLVKGVVNTYNSEFIATSTTPTVWTNGTVLRDTDSPVATVLQSTFEKMVWDRDKVTGNFSITSPEIIAGRTEVIFDTLRLQTIMGATVQVFVDPGQVTMYAEGDISDYFDNRAHEGITITTCP